MTQEYYGKEQPEAITYLEFGTMQFDRCKKEVWDFRVHQRAYDWLMLARYSNDMIAYTKLGELLENDTPLSELVSLYEEEVHHPNDLSLNLSKLCAVIAAESQKDDSTVSYFELGQTIFGCIEGMAFAKSLLVYLGVSHSVVDLKGIRWFGVDISDMFNRLARQLHGEYSVSTGDSIDEFPAATDVFFAKGVTMLYAFRSVDGLVGMISRFRCSLFDYSFSLDESHFELIGTGKTVKFLNLFEYRNAIEKYGISCFVRKNTVVLNPETGRIFMDLVVGSNDACRDFISVDCSVRQQLAEMAALGGNLHAIEKLVDCSAEDWIQLDELIDSLPSPS